MKTLILMTASGAENLGDELITLCEIQNFRAENAEVKIMMFSHDPERSLRFIRSQNIEEKNLTILPYFPTYIKKHPLANIYYFFQTLRTIYISNHVYIWWGGLLYGSTEEWHSPLRLWWMRAKMAKMFGRPVTYLALWVSAKTEELKRYAEGIFKDTTIIVRDTESQKQVEALGYTCTVTSDPVFSYKNRKMEVNQKKEGVTIGIALRAWFVSDEIVTNTIRKLLQKNYTVYLLPHSLHPDDTKSHDGYYLQKFLFPGVKITQTIEQTLATYPECDVIIGMRLHSSILALVMHIPLLAISYSTKTRAILTEMNQSFFDAHEVTSEMLISQIEKLTSN
jgi:polysaccharide pyruvyl transferase WcaK-like protein